MEVKDEVASVSVCTYNILAQAYTRHTLFPLTPRKFLNQSYRRHALIRELSHLDADIYCLQEVDFYHDFWKESLKKLGYGALYKCRAHGKRDGCAIFYKDSLFQVMRTKDVEYDYLVNRPPKEIRDPSRLRTHNVATMATFSDLRTGKHFIVACTHLYWDPKDNDVKYYQMVKLLKEIKLYNRNDLPVIIAGDLNSTPDSAVHQLLSRGYADKDHEDFAGNTSTGLTLMDFLPAQPSKKEEGDEEGGTTEEVEVEEKAEDEEEEDVPDEVIHEFKLKSGYGDYHPERGEPLFTTYTATFQDTIDYIFYEEDKWQLVNTMSLPTEESILADNPALPSGKHPSDHLPLKCTFVIKNS